MSPLSHFQLPFDPIPDPAAIVRGPQVRFSVLTSRLLRLEYSPAERFEDRASQAFWYRRQAAPPFTLTQTPQQIEIDTGSLHLIYRPTPKGLAAATLSVTVKATGKTWRYGDHVRQPDNLRGTARTLDGVSGHTPLEPGLMARSGWAVVDDSASLVFNESGWLENRDAPGNLDLYFFGYGHDYAGCLREFMQVAGPTPLIPRWALGNWWSRYWNYTQAELIGLMQEFKDQAAPLSVCIVDMDWHITETGNTSSGWTGYTWNRKQWPDPPGFIGWLHSVGLKTALNLHPAEGIHPHEEQYEALARRLGLDPAAREPIPFDIADPKFAEGYFTLLHHPYERMGVDFWWMDWQQGTLSRLPGLDPLWWLNHLHFYDLGRDGVKRPFVFSRWGGLGNHRYPIGFSGDTVITWESLEHQPVFTATAANVGYGWWSHDIGGHMGGVEDDELYIRWVQFGVFSPILRLHCTKNPFHERRPWARGPAAAVHVTEAMRLRHALIPYLYSMAWRNHRESLPLITPMYYSHPEADEAYQCPQQYWFGSELIAAPHVAPADPDTRLSRQSVWLPEGDWFDFFSGGHFSGGWRTVYGEVSEIPVFARAGAIVPLGPQAGWGGVENPETLEVLIFPGAHNRFVLYEDDGNTMAYTRGHFAETEFTQVWQGATMTVTIAPVRGAADLVPPRRTFQLRVRGVARPARVELSLNGAAPPAAFEYDEATETLSLSPFTLTPAEGARLSLTAAGRSLLAPRDRRAERLHKYLRNFRMDSWVKAEIAQRYSDLRSGKETLRRHPQVKDVHLAALLTLLES
jgi:alpha-glucosidase (family GH31 glycosyl hydrolase)